MERKLDVYLYDQLAGQLVQDEHGQVTFDYAESWLRNPLAIALSRSLPVSKKHFSRNECRGFFAGILPEESKREVIARNLGISARNDFAMLEQIGGECAGAVTFLPAGQPLPTRENRYQILSDGELAEILKELPRRPLMAGQNGIRLSLAGAQDKLPVHISVNEISIPLGSAPSTHILKPAIERFEGLVFNEAFCMNLARAVGINTANVRTGKVDGIEYLLVERYDRIRRLDPEDGREHLIRKHQEDFCQALGIVPENKYQAEGGPSLQQCFDLVRNSSSTPVIDLQALLNSVVFNLLIGNHDAHGKNFSLLYGPEHEIRLAPLYDVLCTTYYPDLSAKMAMKIGGEYASAKITSKHFEMFADEVGLSKPLVKRRVVELAELIKSRSVALVTSHPAVVSIAQIIQGNCDRAIKFNK